jgi:DNA adenine methylase
MYQYDLFENKMKIPNGIINVASVQKLSPFRYPGGKTWLVPYIYKWIRSLRFTPKTFIEPFAGGGIVSLTAANEGLADRIVMVEIDDAVASVWKTVFYGDVEWLIHRIISFTMSVENATAVLSVDYATNEENAFKTIIKNRISHGGILAKGAGFIKYGENGKGVHSRWYPQTLARRLNHIKKLKNKITFIHGDGLEVIRNHVSDENVFFF